MYARVDAARPRGVHDEASHHVVSQPVAFLQCLCQPVALDVRRALANDDGAGGCEAAAGGTAPVERVRR